MQKSPEFSSKSPVVFLFLLSWLSWHFNFHGWNSGKDNKNRKTLWRIPLFHRSCLNVDLNTKSTNLKLMRKLNPATLIALCSLRYPSSDITHYYLESRSPALLAHSLCSASPSIHAPITMQAPVLPAPSGTQSTWFFWIILTAYSDPVLLFLPHFVDVLYCIMASINQYFLTWCVLNTYFVQNPVIVLLSLYFSIQTGIDLIVTDIFPGP